MKRLITATILLLVCLSSFAKSQVMFNIPDGGIIPPKGGTLSINLHEKMYDNVYYSITCEIINESTETAAIAYNTPLGPKTSPIKPGKTSINIRWVGRWSPPVELHLDITNYDADNALRVQYCVGDLETGTLPFQYM